MQDRVDESAELGLHIPYVEQAPSLAVALSLMVPFVMSDIALARSVIFEVRVSERTPARA